MGTEQSTRSRQSGIQAAMRLVMMALVAAAVVKELRTPAEDRQWNGVVAGFVPYDFRVPTLQRLRERLWNPEGEHFISPHVFGVGWTLNFGKVVATIRDRAGSTGRE